VSLQEDLKSISYIPNLSS